MGIILSRFRKEKTTYQKLESLEDKIKSIEAYTLSTQEQQKRFVGNLLVASIGIYVIAFLLYYFAFLPPTWEERVYRSVPLLLFPIVIFLIKQALAWYYQRRVNKNYNQLSDLRMEKKKILEHVKEKETYKVALEIINKFDQASSFRTPAPIILSTPKSTTYSKGTIMTPQSAFKSTAKIDATPRGKLTNATNNVTSLQQRLNTSPNRPALQQYGAVPPPPSASRSNVGINDERILHLVPSVQRRTPYPIVDQSSKSVVDKMVDYLIGDGPQNRFAMVCKDCFRHNGMALQEEYEYAAFRCAFCNFLNPAKKLRPVAPRIQSNSSGSPIPIKIQRPSASSSDSSDSDSEAFNEKSDESPEIPATNSEELPPAETSPELNEEPIADNETAEETPMKSDADKKSE